MTPEQEDKFAEFGCASRCLLWIANFTGKRILTKSDFVTEFTKDYPFWDTQKNWGGTNTGMILEIARKLNVGQELQVYYSSARARKHIDSKETSIVLVVTEKRPGKSGEWEDFIHCRVANVPQSVRDEWDLVEVGDAIQPTGRVTIKDADLGKWYASFYVFFRLRWFLHNQNYTIFVPG